MKGTSVAIVHERITDLDSVFTIPHEVREVPDHFEGFIEGYIRDADEALVDHTKA